jgi:hypothetical protein
MRIPLTSLVPVILLASSVSAYAQTADEVIEKSIAALGGRAAHAKLKSRLTVGTILVSTPGGDFTGSVEILTAAPNKVRTLIKADLSALGAGPLVFDQRFDGHSGYELDSLQGNREITGNQLDNLRNNSFPHQFLDYKGLGISAKLSGKESAGTREVFLVIFDPTSGSLVRHYIDAQTYLPVRMVMTADIPQLGREIEQTIEFLDYREVDGVKVPFRLQLSSAVQNFTLTIDKIEHNLPVDEKLFSKPAGR